MFRQSLKRPVECLDLDSEPTDSWFADLRPAEGVSTFVPLLLSMAEMQARIFFRFRLPTQQLRTDGSRGHDGDDAAMTQSGSRRKQLLLL